jgi:outer membrane protein
LLGVAAYASAQAPPPTPAPPSGSAPAQVQPPTPVPLSGSAPDQVQPPTPVPLSGSAPAQVQPPTPVIVAPSGSAPAVAPVKVATIFGQNAIISTQEGQKASSALTAKFAPKRDEFNRKQAELQALRDQLKKGQTTLSAEGLANLTKTIEVKNREVQRLGQDSQAALQEEEAAMMQQLGDKLIAIIREYAARSGYAFVIDVSLPNGPVIWASPSIDITNDIVKFYDQAHPVASTPPPAPPQKK